MGPNVYNNIGEVRILLSTLTKENLLEKAVQLKRKRFRPGFDNMNASSTIMWLTVNGNRLIEELSSGTYVPMPAMGFFVAKKDGHYRNLARLTAIDKIIESCMLEELNEVCDPLFSSSSHAYRSGKGVATALQAFCEHGAQYGYCVKVDALSCYDHFCHDTLRQALASFLSDEMTVDLLMKYAKMPVFTEGQLVQRSMGILQGAPISPLLCNIYFHALDRALEEKEIPFVRYADDIVAFSSSFEQVQSVSDFLIDYMQNKLSLPINKKHSSIDASAHLVFLGHRFERDCHGMVALPSGSPLVKAYAAWRNGRIPPHWRPSHILSDGILRQKDFSLLFEHENGSSVIPPETTETINIYSNVIFDSGFLKKAMEKHIGINLFDSYGELIGRFTPNTHLRSPILTHEQLQVYYDKPLRLALAKEFVLGSIHNLRLNIRYYNKHDPQEVYTHSLATINRIEKAIKNCTVYETLLTDEARVRESYYACYDTMLKQPGFVFEKRTRRPPENEFNALLSFGNVLLYNLIATKLNKTPLDIRVGYLHATNTRMESLNLDIAELFRPLIVDRVALSLVNKRMLNAGHFIENERGGFYLQEDGKRIFLQAFYEKLDDTLMIDGQSRSYDAIISDEIRKLVRFFRSGEKYKAFRQVR